MSARLADLMQDAADRLVSGEASAPRAAAVRLDIDGQSIAAAAGEATPGTAFHIASIGKLFTAAMVLQLAEEGRLGPSGVDATLVETGAFEPVLLDALHIRDGVARGGSITVRQLLTHTSGLGDVFNDDAQGTALHHGRPAPNGLSAKFYRALRALTAGDEDAGGLARRVWTLWDPRRPGDPDAGLLNAYVAELGSAPVAPPGERFHYSDQGYQLLALLIERLDAAPYARAQRLRLLEPLGLGETWMHGRESPPAGLRAAVAEVFMSGVPVFASGANLSFDYGGGGQVSTTADLARFLSALRAGRPFREASTVRSMWTFVTPPSLAPPRTGVALGPQRWVSRFSGAAMEGHAGAWGAHLWWDPRTGAIVAGAVSQRDDSGFAFRLLDDVAASMGRASPADETTT